MKTLTTREVRQINRLKVLHHIFHAGSITRLEISEISDLSPATITNLVGELIAEGMVVESGLAESQGGRPRSTLTINPAYGYLIGVELTEPYLEFELFDFQLNSVGIHQFSLVYDENQPEQIVASFRNGYLNLLTENGITEDQVIGIGVGVPGLVEEDSGVSVFAPNWGWHNVKLKAMLDEITRIPFYLDNCLRANAMSELWFGAGRGADNLVAIIIATGVGAGIITNGLLYRGVSNSAGEWGHTNIVLDGRLCHCGSKGCIEAYTGALGIIQTLGEIAPDSKLLALDDQVKIIKDLTSAALKNDPVATAVFQETAHYLGAGIANIINLFNPQMIILGGWVGLQIGPIIFDELMRVIKSYSLERPFNTTKILISPQKRNPVTIGAALLALDRYLLDFGKTSLTPCITIHDSIK